MHIQMHTHDMVHYTYYGVYVYSTNYTTSHRSVHLRAYPSAAPRWYLNVLPSQSSACCFRHRCAFHVDMSEAATTTTTTTTSTTTTTATTTTNGTTTTTNNDNTSIGVGSSLDGGSQRPAVCCRSSV